MGSWEDVLTLSTETGKWNRSTPGEAAGRGGRSPGTLPSTLRRERFLLEAVT